MFRSVEPDDYREGPDEDVEEDADTEDVEEEEEDDELELEADEELTRAAVRALILPNPYDPENEVSELEAEARIAEYDDDPNPYAGTYSEE